jgi:hypothetical protein
MLECVPLLGAIALGRVVPPIIALFFVVFWLLGFFFLDSLLAAGLLGCW